MILFNSPPTIVGGDKRGGIQKHPPKKPGGIKGGGYFPGFEEIGLHWVNVLTSLMIFIQVQLHAMVEALCIKTSDRPAMLQAPLASVLHLHEL